MLQIHSIYSINIGEYWYSMQDIEDIANLKPCCPAFAPKTIRNLKIGSEYLWCSCGLSKDLASNDWLKAWCDESCEGTSFKPLAWICDRNQSLFSICVCKYTKDPVNPDYTNIYSHSAMQFTLPCRWSTWNRLMIVMRIMRASSNFVKDAAIAQQTTSSIILKSW